MERKQGFFAALKEEMARGLSPSRSRRGRSQSSSPSGLMRLRRGCSVAPPEMYVSRSSSVRPGAEALSPLREGPDSGDPRADSWANWLCRAPTLSNSGSGCSKSDLRLLLGVLGAPLAPVRVSNNEPLPHLCIKDTPIVSFLSQSLLLLKVPQLSTFCSNIWQHLGARRFETVYGMNAYAMGKVKMLASDIETTASKVIKTRNSSKAVESGGFVLWQMNPDMWYVELALGGSKIHAGCNGKLVWRHTPWLGAHLAKGPVRPLRRALQGFDPGTAANMFVNARCTGEKKINGEDCFILKLCADPHTLKARSEGPAGIIRHVLFGYFSQKTGLLGVMVAHSGRSVVTLFRFGETAMSHTKTRMEEVWTIEEVAFNVPGLSGDCFIPPAELNLASIGESCELPQQGRAKNAAAATAYRAKAKVAVHPSLR
ncbi:hypothetical protein SASPL_115570 [Salvia splendens]|uniref:Uncharacterized protein n=1 Tax=Salvia splendens TaxID=180675 RepID=A0A8X9A356_SALSN|nr:hypothetical protein SASPL_115570 [Salvia splendens]